MMKLYHESILPNGKYRITIMGILKRQSFLAQPHLEKFFKHFEYTDSGFITVLECDNEYSYKKIKKILDYNLKEECFLDSQEEFRFKIVC